MADNGDLVSGFIDLVGVRDLARESSSGYWDALIRFQTHVADICTALEGDSGKIFLFSDSIFVQAEGFRGLANFMRSLRHRLLDEGLYFKGSIRPGGLEAREAYVLPLVRNKKDEEERKKKLAGHCFGENAATLFALQEQLKGIGILVDEAAVSNGQADGTAYSCFLPQVGSQRSEPYLDLLLEQDDLDDGILERLLQKFFKAKSRSKKIGRFYVSLLVLWVQSIDFSSISYDPSSEGGLINLLLSGRFERLFGDVVGIENIYLCLLNRLYVDRDKVPIALFYDTRRYILSRRRLSRSLDNIPFKIFSSSARNEFLEDLSFDLMRKSPEERQSMELILDMASEGKKDTDMAEELNRRNLRQKSGRPWSWQAVRNLRQKK